MRASIARVVIAALAVTYALAGQVSAVAATSSGFNDWSCQPSAAHPRPLVLLHGLGGNGPGHFSYLGPYLASAGYCAFAPTYGQASPAFPVGGTVSITRSSAEIAQFVDRVRGTTGSSTVDIVGHSEGAFQALYGPKVLGYHAKVRNVVALAPPTHGTTFGGLVSFGDFLGLRPLVDIVLNTFGCQACDELIVGGSAVNRLVNDPIAQPGISYTIIASRYDALVTPTETSFVDEPGVHNTYVQQTCAADPVGHIGMAFDTGIAQMITNALDPPNAKPVTCGFGPPF
jgi:pimeloyl-ACP methyl ester carboxylesterase